MKIALALTLITTAAVEKVSAAPATATAGDARNLRTSKRPPTNKPTTAAVVTTSIPCTTSCSAGTTCTPTAEQQYCIAMYDPVCGCDGIEYSNECSAFKAGVNVASTGSC